MTLICDPPCDHMLSWSTVWSVHVEQRMYTCQTTLCVDLYSLVFCGLLATVIIENFAKLSESDFLNDVHSISMECHSIKLGSKVLNPRPNNLNRKFQSS